MTPDHYLVNGKDPISIFRHLPFYQGNVIKYLIRCTKSGKLVQDLEKALVYLELARADASFEARTDFHTFAKIDECSITSIPQNYFAICKLYEGKHDLCESIIRSMLNKAKNEERDESNGSQTC